MTIRFVLLLLLAVPTSVHAGILSNCEIKRLEARQWIIDHIHPNSLCLGAEDGPPCNDYLCGEPKKMPSGRTPIS